MFQNRFFLFKKAMIFQKYTYHKDRFNYERDAIKSSFFYLFVKKYF